MKSHHLKPFGLAEFTESAALWDICSSILRLHVSCLASPRKAGFYNRQTRQSLNLDSTQDRSSFHSLPFLQVYSLSQNNIPFQRSFRYD